MKLKDKYKALSDPAFVKQMMVASAYGTMQLENQPVPFKTVEELYDKVLQKRALLKKS